MNYPIKVSIFFLRAITQLLYSIVTFTGDDFFSARCVNHVTVICESVTDTS